MDSLAYQSLGDLVWLFAAFPLSLCFAVYSRDWLSESGEWNGPVMPPETPHQLPSYIAEDS